MLRTSPSMFPWLKTSFAEPLLQRLLFPSRSLAKGGEAKPLERGHQAAKLGWSQLSSRTLRTTSGAAGRCPSPTPSEARSLPAQTRAVRRNPSILQPRRWVKEADLMKAHGNPLPHSWLQCFLLQGLVVVADEGRHFGEHVYRVPAKPQEVPAPGDEEWEEEADEASALSTPLHCRWQMKARAQQRCYAGPCKMQGRLESSALAFLSQSSSVGEAHQQRKRKASEKYAALLHISSVK